MKKRIILGILSLIGLITVVVLSLYAWRSGQRPERSPIEEVIAPGITYYRQVVDTPRPLVAHIVQFDLQTAGGRLFVTPGDAGEPHEITARRTSTFAAEFEAIVSINGSFFAPFWVRTPLFYYPREGERVDILGQAVSDGVSYSDYQEAWSGVCINDREIEIVIGPCEGEYDQILSASTVFMRAGSYSVTESKTSAYNLERHPRTAVAISEDGRRFFMIVVDGRQPRYSEGVNLRELAEIIVPFGAYRAITLDGGGSSTLVIRRGEELEIMNAPIHGRWPGTERPVGNHLGWIGIDN